MTTKQSGGKFERVLVTLPHDLASQLRQFADDVREGNKSGFVADALRAYIRDLLKRRRTQKLRESYAAAAGDSQAIAQEWDPLSDEAWGLNESKDKQSGKK